MSAGPSLPVENSTENRSSRARLASALVLYNVMNAALSTLPLVLCVYLREKFRINTPAVLGVNATTATLGDNTTTVATFTEEESFFDPLLYDFWLFMAMCMGVFVGIVLSIVAACLPSRFHRPERDPALLRAEFKKFMVVGATMALYPAVFVPFLVGWEGHQDISSDYFAAVYPANALVYFPSHLLTMAAVFAVKNLEGMRARIYLAVIAASVVNMVGGSLVGLYCTGTVQRLVQEYAIQNAAPANATTAVTTGEADIFSANPDFATFLAPLLVTLIAFFTAILSACDPTVVSETESAKGLKTLLMFMGFGALVGVMEGGITPSFPAMSLPTDYHFNVEEYGSIYGKCIPLGAVLGVVIGLMTYVIFYGASCQQASAAVATSTEGTLTEVLVEEVVDAQEDDEQREGYVPPKPKAVDPDSNLLVTASAQGAGAPLTGIELARMGPAQSQ